MLKEKKKQLSILNLKCNCKAEKQMHKPKIKMPQHLLQSEINTLVIMAIEALNTQSMII